MILRKLALMAAVLLTALSISAKQPMLKAYGHIVGNFSRVNINGVMNVDIRHNPDSTGYVVFYTYPEYSKALKVSNNSGELELRTEIDNHSKGYFMYVTVYPGSLDKVTNGADGRVTLSSIKLNRKSTFELKHDSSGQMTVKCPITAKNISLRNTASGTLSITGALSTQSISVNNSGSGSISATRLNGTNATVKNSGSGKLEISGIQATDVNCSNSGSGSVTLSGTTVSATLNNTGSGNLNSSDLQVTGR